MSVRRPTRPALRSVVRGPFAGGFGEALEPEVATYKAAKGISASAAKKLSRTLSELRASGMEPSLLWFGGSEFNNAAQTGAVIGGDATLVGVKAGVPAASGSNACLFNRSKFLRFANPAATKGAALSSFVMAIWYEVLDDAQYSNLAHAWTNTNRGPLLQGVYAGAPGVFQNLSLYPSAAGAVFNLRKNPGGGSDSQTGLRQLLVHYTPGASGTKAIVDGDQHSYSPPGAALYNDHAYFYIGGLDPAQSSDLYLANAKIYAVAIAPTMTDSQAARVRAANAPLTSGFMAASDTPIVVTMGDSTTQSRWGQHVAGATYGGQWYRRVAWDDQASFGTSLDYHVAQSDALVEALKQKAWGNRFFYYAPEVLLESAATALGIANTEAAWKARTLEFILDIQTRSGCQVILGSYIKGNAATDTAGITPYNDYFETEAAARGWLHVPFYDDPHSQVWTGASPGTYGFYEDAIHPALAGQRIQAEVFAAAVPHPDSAAPRFNLAAPPTITGTATVGQVLSCSTGTLHVAGTSYTYQWLADNVAISGATSSTYTLQAGQAGKRVACRVTAVKSGQNSASFTAAPTAAVS